jgi:hypothetical protein
VRLLVLSALAVLLAGCGGSGGGFADHASASCADANEHVRALGPEPQILTAAQANWLGRLTAVDRVAVTRIRALDVPEDERATVSSMLSGFDRGLARGAAIARASRRGDFPALRREVDAANADFSRARTMAEQYGLHECAQLGRVDR